ncbi:DUF3172 domain-containing protein [Gloeocapsa sp. PCC 73106]|uniref:DUF3172 domain-containing protein n=1 Tax=Gloeocapsa sp. PCC 73106 TaxID=102232 RepID=UPI0002AC816C|nr:DUF3172 domain-containing protein [Gloeocapsa sp. PCC 73106]ELR96608.1 Protein of unknown function (DUF3172) [Gloeocapsa sp. PCC 73106]
MKRSSRYSDPRVPSPRSTPSSNSPFKLTIATIAILGVVFLMGIGAGIGFSSTASFSPENVASREVIDRSAPNPELCVQFGASAIVTDMRIFLTLNPFNVFVTQPVMTPGCVLRRNNWTILEQQSLVTPEQVRNCKNRMNTFGYTGNLEESPAIDCIYQNKAAGNFFLNRPGAVTSIPETNKF